jgi:hypothetical protein
VVVKAQNLLTDPNSRFEELASIIETDQEITLNILNLANSAYYSHKNEVYSVYRGPDPGQRTHIYPACHGKFNPDERQR